MDSQQPHLMIVMKNLYTVILSTMFLQAIIMSDESKYFDFQLRIPLHLQYGDLYTNRLGKFGFSAWSIFSDVTDDNNRTANFNIAGPFVQYGQKGSWLEVMGGFKRTEDGYYDPAVDVRLLDKSLPRLNIRAELAYFPSESRRRFYAWIAMDTPVPIGKYQVLAGFESEDIVSYSGKNDSLGIGPRLVVPLPFVSKISPSLSSSITITYQFRNDRDFVRCYLGLSYVFGKKQM